MTQHRDLAGTQHQHAPWRWTVTDTSALAALTVTAEDVGKVALVQADNTARVLTGHDPVAWHALGVVQSVNSQTGTVTLAAGDVGADPEGSASAAETAANTYTDDHATETDGIHGIPDGERALHTADGVAQSVDSVADLRAASFPDSLERIWLSGYYGAGTDGGGPLYRDSDDTTTADNGATVFVDADGVRWKRNELLFDADYAARLQAVMDAEWIRRNAGIPSWVHVGVEPGVATGLADEAALEPETRLDLGSESDVSAAANSGTGAENDPYVIENRDLNNSEGATASAGIQFNDPNYDVDDPYYVVFRNCRVTGYNDYQLYLINGPHVTFESCQIFDPAEDWIRMNSAGAQPFRSVTFDKCKISGAGGSDFSGSTTDFVFRNTVFTEDSNAWAAGAVAVDPTNGNYRFKNCEATAPSLSAVFEAPSRKNLSFEIDKCDFSGPEKLLYTPGSGNLGWSKGTITNTRFGDCVSSQIEMGALEDFLIEHCEFNDTPDGVRNCWLTSRGQRGCRNGVVRWCKFTKTTGTNTAGNECLETYTRGENVVFEYCWVTDCPEDAYEHAQQIGGCEVRHCVADNTQGQAVDIFKSEQGHEQPSDTSVKSIGCVVEYIYGTCGLAGGSHGYGVIVDNSGDLRIQSIFVDNSASTAPLIRIRNRDLDAGEGPNDCSIIGPLSLPRSIGNGEAVQIDSDAGTGNSAIWQEGGRIRRIGQSAEEEGRTQIV